MIYTSDLWLEPEMDKTYPSNQDVHKHEGEEGGLHAREYAEYDQGFRRRQVQIILSN